jgi:hypothetical protein
MPLMSRHAFEHRFVEFKKILGKKIHEKGLKFHSKLMIYEAKYDNKIIDDF